MSEEEINEALKIIKEPITVNSIEYKYFNQENYEKLLSVYENAKWFVSNWEQALQNIKDLQQKVEQLEKEVNEYQKELEKADSITQSCIFQGKQESKISFRNCLNRLEQLENIRKEAIKFINEWLFEAGGNGADMDYDTIVDLLNILNKGSDKE